MAPNREPYQLNNMLSIMKFHLGEEVFARWFLQNECPHILLSTADATKVGGSTLHSETALARRELKHLYISIPGITGFCIPRV